MDQQILATVNGKAITQADVDAFLAQMGASAARYNNAQGRAMILEQLINQKLFLLDAQRNFYESELTFKAQLNKIKEDLLSNYAVSKVIDKVSVTDADARAYFNEHQSEMVSGETVNASHILVDSEEKAKEILAEIQAGTISFEDAAKKYSSCPSAKQGGNLGDFSQGQMVPEFDKAVFAMEVGQLTGPVKTQFGYHLIRLNAKNAAEAMKFEDVREELKEQLLSQKQQEAYQHKVNQLKIMYPVDKF